MNKSQIRNVIVLSLSIIFAILAYVGYIIDNSMMMLISIFLAFLFLVRLVILFIFYSKLNKQSKELKLLEEKSNKTPYESLYMVSVKSKEEDYFNDDTMYLEASDPTAFKVNFEYRDIEVEFNVIPNYIVYKGNKEPISILTFDDLVHEINSKINQIKSNIDDSYNGDNSILKESKLEKSYSIFNAYTKYVKNLLFISIFTIVILLASLIIMLYTIPLDNRDNKIGIVLTSLAFLVIICILVVQIIYSIKIMHISKLVYDDKNNNRIKEITTTCSKVRLLKVKQGSSSVSIVGVFLITPEGDFIIPFTTYIYVSKFSTKKEFKNELLNKPHKFKYLTNSKLVISNNEKYEKLLEKIS